MPWEWGDKYLWESSSLYNKREILPSVLVVLQCMKTSWRRWLDHSNSFGPVKLFVIVFRFILFYDTNVCSYRTSNVDHITMLWSISIDKNLLPWGLFDGKGNACGWQFILFTRSYSMLPKLKIRLSKKAA